MLSQLPVQFRGFLLLLLLLAGSWLLQHWPPRAPAEVLGPAAQPFRLDVNTAYEAELQRLPGVSARLAQQIVAYRNAHGYFHAVSDLQQVPDMGQHWQQLAPLLYVDTLALLRLKEADTLAPGPHRRQNLNYASAETLSQPGLLPRKTAALLVMTRQQQGPYRHYADLMQRVPLSAHERRVLELYFYCGKTIPILDLNLADSGSLRQLPGIGQKLAARIVRYRHTLGYYHAVEQLRELPRLSEKNYRRMQPYLYVRQRAGVMTLDSLRRATRLRHPYFRGSEMPLLEAWALQLDSLNRPTFDHAPVSEAWRSRALPYMAFRVYPE
jgi:competence ComEA-like helix-hairpin-helix protein